MQPLARRRGQRRLWGRTFPRPVWATLGRLPYEHQVQRRNQANQAYVMRTLREDILELVVPDEVAHGPSQDDRAAMIEANPEILSVELERLLV